MSRDNLRRGRIHVPEFWSPHAALAAFEFIDQIRAAIWRRYGPDIYLEFADVMDPGEFPELDYAPLEEDEDEDEQLGDNDFPF